MAFSSGLVGLFGREALGQLGFSSDFGGALLLAAGLAAGFAALQLLYVALARFIAPTRAAAHLLVESLSQLCAVILLPYILHAGIHWPIPALAKFEPLICLGAFAVPHLFFKLMSFYAAIRGTPARRFAALGWLAASVFFALVGSGFVFRWLGKAEQLRPTAPEAIQPYRIGDAYANARVFPEGARVSYDIASYDNGCLAFYLANVPPTPGAEPDTLGTIFVNVVCAGDKTIRQTLDLSLDNSGWAELLIPPDAIPKNAKTCALSWDSEKPPLWQRLSRIRPVMESDHSVLLSGPCPHELAAPNSAPNFVFLVIDGLGARHVTGLGYKRATTPSLDRVGQAGFSFLNAYTPAPDSMGACMTMLTGASPLRHRYMQDHPGPLPRGINTLAEALEKAHYATAAFTEGEAPTVGVELFRAAKDLIFGSGFERGFELFDSSWSEEAGAKHTLDDAKAWIASHANRKFMAFIRFQELTRSVATTLDDYDAAIASLDREIGAFIKAIRPSPAGKNTCFIVTSSYGLDFSNESAGPRPALTEESLHVPLMISLPGVEKPQRRPALVSLEDLMPTILRLAQTKLDYKLDGKDLIQDPRDRIVISMYGNPLALSVRMDKWRLSWQSDACPFAPKLAAAERIIEFYDVARAKKIGYKHDLTATQPDTASRLKIRLKTYLEQQLADP